MKNKVAPPFKEAEFDIMYGEGISRIGEIVDLAVKLEIIEKTGAWFTVEENRIQGRDGVKQFLIDNPDVADRVEAQVRANAERLSPIQRRQATGTDGVVPVNVSADDFDEG